jgi:hypothetical protein
MPWDPILMRAGIDPKKVVAWVDALVRGPPLSVYV